MKFPASNGYVFRNRFPPELSEEFFAHILNKALNHRMVDPSTIFMDGTHIKASANKKDPHSFLHRIQ